MKDGVITLFGQLKTQAVNRFVELRDNILNIGRTWATRMIEIGRNIIQGLIDGVGAMAGALVAAMQGIVDRAIDAILRALGLRSPSRVFAEIGRYTMLGYIRGISSMRPALVREMQTTAGAIVKAGDTSGLLNPTIGLSNQGQRTAQPSYANATKQTGAPTYNITINNPVPERAGDSVRRELLYLSAGVLA